MGERRLHGCFGTVMGLALAVLTAMLLGRGLSACDAGVNGAANSTFLVVLFIPSLWSLLTLSWVMVGVLLGRQALLHALALTVVLAAVCWCAVSLFWSGATHECPSGVPPWWPGFLPVPGF
ncbi:hypothetical protein [Streptomyces pseudovenezuelae]|uniref:hypothetical protein n=1 Tax=Streptomyces pseudovenezuelae TaxID=67350 RepID=UPI0036E9522D